eukprot:161889-Hanusia_phi.AAC.1
MQWMVVAYLLPAPAPPDRSTWLYLKYIGPAHHPLSVSQASPGLESPRGYLCIAEARAPPLLLAS